MIEFLFEVNFKILCLSEHCDLHPRGSDPARVPLAVTRCPQPHLSGRNTLTH